MVGYVFLGICLIAALLLAGKALLNSDPRLLARIARWVLVVGILLVAGFFLVTGRYPISIGVLIFLLPFLRRGLMAALRGRLAGRAGAGTASPGQTSSVETAYLRMHLRHDDGMIEGEVLQGPLAGRKLQDLNGEELWSLYETCLREDHDAVALMETYMERVLGADWRNQGGGQGQQKGWGAKPGTNSMSRQEALEVLGLREGASVEEIREAHRRLILKNHPDQGGSGFLAAKINQAKEVLIGG